MFGQQDEFVSKLWKLVMQPLRVAGELPVGQSQHFYRVLALP